MMYYKVLGKNHMSCNGGNAMWIKGKWMPEIKKGLVPCIVGYHLCRKKDLIEWLNEEIWVAEGRGKKIVCDDKVVFSIARIVKKLDAWDDRSARLFACDCAEHVLRFYEKFYPDDTCVRDCISVSRRFALGKATKKELSAASSAAWSAASSAAWSASSAASSAAWSAASSAAWSASSAAWSAERKWQTKRLFEYLDDKEL